MSEDKINDLEKKAVKIRLGAVRAVHAGKSGHPGGALSCADILACLYFSEMNVNPAKPDYEDRDRFVLSKGHSAPALYAALAERGFFPADDLDGFRHLGSYLQGHPDMKHIPGVDMSSGSLGQGISAACGMALSSKISGKTYRVYSILGDGECEEGQVWEAAMFAAHYKLDNLCVFVDANGLQIDGPVTEVINPTPLDSKFASFGWNVINIDGHSIKEILTALSDAKKCSGKPTAVIAKTVKGKGVSFMENQVGWHGKAPNDEEYQTAVAELESAFAAI